MIRAFTFEQYHAKKSVGSTRIRIHQLAKYWDEFDLYKYGENPDVLIFQKVYVTKTYKFPISFENIKILDICDPDWVHHDYYVKETCDAMDAVVCTTETIKKHLEQCTDTPIRVIKDRFDLSEFPKPKIHNGKAKSVVWFGYKHNSSLIKGVLPFLKENDIKLTVISDGDPYINRYDKDVDYEFKKYKQSTIYNELQKHDFIIHPKGYRPQDRFKSENKTTIGRLLGMPVAHTPEEFKLFLESDNRNLDVEKWYNVTRKEFDVHESIKEYKQLINDIKESKNV